MFTWLNSKAQLTPLYIIIQTLFPISNSPLLSKNSKYSSKGGVDGPGWNKKREFFFYLHELNYYDDDFDVYNWWRPTIRLMIRHNLLDSTSVSFHKLGNTLIPRLLLCASYARFSNRNARYKSWAPILWAITENHTRGEEEEEEEKSCCCCCCCGMWLTEFFFYLFTRKSMEHGTSTEKPYICIIRV